MRRAMLNSDNDVIHHPLQSCKGINIYHGGQYHAVFVQLPFPCIPRSLSLPTILIIAIVSCSS